MEPVYRLTELLLRRPLRHGLSWRIEGSERIPADGPCLLASNHISYFDPIAVAFVTDRAGRRVRTMTKVELFEHWIMGPIMRGFGNIPVDRGSADARALELAAATLAAGECVVVYPEGTLSGNLEPMAGRTGVARLAKAAGLPIVPLGLWGTHRVIPPFAPDGATRKPRPRWGCAVTAVLGEPVVVGPSDNPREATDRIMGGIVASVARARAIYPQTPKPGESTWWVRGPQSARLLSCRGKVAQQLLDQPAGPDQLDPRP